MDIEFWKFSFQVLQFLITGALAVYVYLSNKDKVTNDRIGKLEDDLDIKLDGHGERLSALEVATESAPNHEHLGNLHEKINTVDVKVSGIAGRIEGIDATLRQLMNHIVSKGLQ